MATASFLRKKWRSGWFGALLLSSLLLVMARRTASPDGQLGHPGASNTGANQTKTGWVEFDCTVVENDKTRDNILVPDAGTLSNLHAGYSVDSSKHNL